MSAFTGPVSPSAASASRIRGRSSSASVSRSGARTGTRLASSSFAAAATPRARLRPRGPEQHPDRRGERVRMSLSPHILDEPQGARGRIGQIVVQEQAQPRIVPGPAQDVAPCRLEGKALGDLAAPEDRFGVHDRRRREPRGGALRVADSLLQDRPGGPLPRGEILGRKVPDPTVPVGFSGGAFPGGGETDDENPSAPHAHLLDVIPAAAGQRGGRLRADLRIAGTASRAGRRSSWDTPAGRRRRASTALLRA